MADIERSRSCSPPLSVNITRHCPETTYKAVVQFTHSQYDPYQRTSSPGPGHRRATSPGGGLRRPQLKYEPVCQKFAPSELTEGGDSDRKTDAGPEPSDDSVKKTDSQNSEQGHEDSVTKPGHSSVEIGSQHSDSGHEDSTTKPGHRSMEIGKHGPHTAGNKKLCQTVHKGPSACLDHGEGSTHHKSKKHLQHEEHITTHSEHLDEEWEREKQELKTKLSELEEYQDKYEQEKKENQILQNQLQELMTGQSDATRNLMRANDSLDRLRLDQRKKTEQIEKMQVDIRFKDDRIRNLEIRASEVEKAELILETTKHNLEQTIQQVRVRDGQIKQLDKEVDDHKRQLDSAHNKIKEMEEKMEDMKIQVRHEIMKNENIEKNLETIPRLKDTIKEREDEIKDLKKHIEEKNALLTAARKAVREYKEKLRYTEHEISRTEVLKQDLELSQCEVQSLKSLMYGKDYLVSQKTKALDLSKEIIGVLNDPTESDYNGRLQHLMDRLSEGQPSRTTSSRSNGSTLPSSSTTSDQEFRCVSAPPPKSFPNPNHRDRDIDVNNYPYSLDSDHNGNHSEENGYHGNHAGRRQYNQTSSDTQDRRKRPVTAQPVRRSASHIQRTSSFKEAKKVYNKPLPRKNNGFEIEIVTSPRQNRNTYKSEKQVNSKFKPSLEYSIGASEPNTNDKLTDSESSPEKSQLPSDADSVFSSESDFEDDVTSEHEYVVRGVPAREKDNILNEIINVGDRVLISCPQKPPKYGKKRVLKPINYTGIVKFKGKLNPDKYDARVHVGLRMDDQVGDTDGTYKGKRLMYTPSDQGKFFKIRDLTSVLNVKTGRYIPIQRLIVHHVHRKQRSQSESRCEN